VYGTNVEENECQNFVNTNYQQIVKAIQVGTNPTIACMALMVCEQDTVIGGSKHDVGLIKENVQPTKTPTESVKLDESDECAACEAFVTVFGDRLNNDLADINEIDIIELCYEVGTSYKDQVSGGLLNLIRYGCMMKTEDPNEDWVIRSLIETMRTTCIGRCVKKPNGYKFHPKCAICKDVIRDIKNKIENSPVEKNFKYRLEGLCAALPPPKKGKCVDLVAAYTDKFVNTVIDDIKEESVCMEIGYC